MPKQAQKNGQDLTPPTIQVTFDYSAFEFFDSNRQPTHWEKVAQSIGDRNLTKFNPIMVIERGSYYAIIDGQNRFMACKSLGLPIYFIDATDEMKEHDMAMLNSNQKNWSTADFIRHHATMGNPIYQEMLDLIDPINIAGHYVITRHKTNEHTLLAIKKGNVVGINKDRYYKACEIYTALQSSRSDISWKRNPFMKSIPKLLNNENFSVSYMVEKINSYPDKLYSCSNRASFIEMLTDLYNYNRRVDNRI